MQALARRYNRRDGLSVAPMLEAVQSFTSDNVQDLATGLLGSSFAPFNPSISPTLR